MKISIDDTDKIASLDNIIDMVFDGEKAGPAFIRAHDDNIMSEIKKYTGLVKNTELNKTDVEALETFAEEESASLLDAILQANRDYFREGMKFCTHLLAELLC